MQIKMNKLPKSEIEIEGELEADVFEGYFEKALKKIGENIEIDGFRKGKAPENVLLSKIPEAQILGEMAEMALSENYPKILIENKIDAISRPEISITKLVRKNPLGFKIKTAILPEIKMPDYKKIAKKVVSEITDTEKNFEPTEKEVKDTIMDIRKSRAPKIKTSDVEGAQTSDVKELPDFNNKFVQALGPFKDIEDFKDKLKENMKLEKENGLKEKTRLKIAEEIVEGMSVDLPEIFIESELEKILYRMKSDITVMGLKFEDYLKHIKKTKEDLKKEFHEDAEKKAKLALALNEISKLENIKADPKKVASEVAMILEHYKEADPVRAEMHAENVLTNEAIFQFLENQK